jgi:mannose-6-phosphate isomerase-like protein (cupin superfamily)
VSDQVGGIGVAGYARAIELERVSDGGDSSLAGEGEQIGGPTAVPIKATGEETSHSFYLGEVVVAPGFPGPPPHVHEQLHDMFYVLDGMLTMRLGEERASS